jgi:uncharacterized NAD(P)/FAD-binding protein YdhS
MTGLPGKRVIIIGGGASGVLMACHLLREKRDDFVVTLIERRSTVGPGVAYSTALPEHLLNVRAANMSAFADDPGHFWRWLADNALDQAALCPDPYCFVPRLLYGRYISSLMEEFLPAGGRPGRLHIVHGECHAVDDRPGGVAVTLADGSTHLGQAAVLATGNDSYDWQQSGRYLSPWSDRSRADLDTGEPILILGSGLSMVDYVLTLSQQGHRGPIHSLSRRGLLPHAHRDFGAEHISKEDVPFGLGAGGLLRWFRQLVANHHAQGGDWRSIVDGIRPHSQEIWWKFSIASKSRFVEHVRSYWDVHRHRVAPQINERLQMIMASGQLSVLAAKIVAVDERDQGIDVIYRRRGQTTSETLSVKKIVDCRGIVTDPWESENPVVASLLAQGLARPDALRIGIDVSVDCAVLNAAGSRSRRLFAVGPLTRASFWETIAIPDIRSQCAKLVRHIRSSALAGAV